MKKIVFIVDDNDTNLLIAKNALNDIYKTYAMPSAARMFKLAEKIKPDLILLDVIMPEMNGFEALQKMKSDEKMRSFPVIFLTGMDDEASIKHGLEMGALDYIKKPFSPADLVQRIEAHIK